MKTHLEKIKSALSGMNSYIKKNGLPACVEIDQKDIDLCERPFPFTEGNDAKTEIEFFRIEQEHAGRKMLVESLHHKMTLRITVLSK